MNKKLKIKINISALIAMIFTFLIIIAYSGVNCKPHSGETVHFSRNENIINESYSKEVKKTILKVKFWESWEQSAHFRDGLIEVPHYFDFNHFETIKGVLGKDGFYTYELHLDFPQSIRIGAQWILIPPEDTVVLDYSKPYKDHSKRITSTSDTTFWHFSQLQRNLGQYKLIGIIPGSDDYINLSPIQYEQRIDSFYQAGVEYIKKYFAEYPYLDEFYHYYAKSDLLFRVARQLNFYYYYNNKRDTSARLEEHKRLYYPKDYFKYNDSISNSFSQLFISDNSNKFFNDYVILLKNISDDYESKLNWISNNTDGLIRDIVLGRTISHHQLRKFEEKYLPISLRFVEKIKDERLRLDLSSRINEIKNSETHLTKEVFENQPKSLNELLANYHDKVVYVEFWATWCGPCLEDAEYLGNLHSQIRNKNFKIVNICVLSPKITWEKHLKSKTHFGDHIYLDNQSYKYLRKEIYVPHYPYYLLIDQKRNSIVKDAPRPYSGKDSKINEDLTYMINKMLKE